MDNYGKRNKRGGGGNHNNKSKKNQRGGRNGGRNMKNGVERNFPKFVDVHHNNESNYWPQYKWDYNRNNNYNNNNWYLNNGNDGGPGIMPWHRKNPIPLIIPPQHEIIAGENKRISYDTEVDVQKIRESVEHHSAENSISQRILNNSVESVSKCRANTTEAKIPADPKFTVPIKLEKNEVKLKKERKSSSSSSSQSESSSSEEEPETPQKSVSTKLLDAETAPTTTVSTKTTPSSPTNLKFKPESNPVKTTAISSTKTAPESSDTSSSSSSSSDEGEKNDTPPPQVTKTDNEANSQTNVKLSKNKNSSEDDVVCMGNLENKIVLEDDSESADEGENEDESNNESSTKMTKSSHKERKKNTKKSSDKCMICDKKGHTSFQCQMICKNCSAPYHGYRTCPHPANLNIMLQLFMEFCMQQLQSFNVGKQFSTNSTDNFLKQQVDSPLTNVNQMKSSKHKRRQPKSIESSLKTKSTKRRKLSSTTKNTYKDNESNDDDDDTSETSSQKSEEETSESENTLSSVENLISSKNKLKVKSKHVAKSAQNLSTVTPNPVNLPLVINGFPNLSAGSAAVTNPSSSTNALNTLLLTQMFQNAIGSLK